MSFAETHGLQVEGHTLVWHHSLPAWASDLSTGDPRAAMLNHIQNAVGHSAGRILA